MAVKNVRLNIAAQATYPTLPQLEVTQGVGSTLTAINESLVSEVCFSLDGINDSFRAIPNVVAGATFQGKYTKLWARIVTPSVSPVFVQLIAES